MEHVFTQWHGLGDCIPFSNESLSPTKCEGCGQLGEGLKPSILQRPLSKSETPWPWARAESAWQGHRSLLLTEGRGGKMENPALALGSGCTHSRTLQLDIPSPMKPKRAASPPQLLSEAFGVSSPLS